MRQARRHGSGREGGPGHAPHLKHPLFHRAEALEVLLQHLPQALGHSAGYGGQPHPQRPSPVCRDEPAAAHPILHHRDHEERIALGALMYEARQPGRESGVWKARRQVGSHSRFGEQRERQFRTLPMPLQLVVHDMQRMAPLQRVGETIRAQQQESSRFPPSRQHCKQVEGGVVAPVQVFEHQQQRLSGGQQIKGLSQFTEHPVPGRTGNAAPHYLQIGGTHQAGHLHQPGRGLLPQERHHLLPAGSPTQASQRLQHRQIGLPCPVMFEALAAPDPERPIRLQGREERIDQRGFAEPRLPRDEEELAYPGQGSGQSAVQRVQCALAPGEQRRGHRESRARG